jgi:RNA polymerase sigma-70 factor (ECF subfamily)
VAHAAVRLTDQRETQLVDAARAGDSEAFRHLTQPHYRQLHVHCYRMLGSFHDAEDLVQETFVRAWRSLDTYESRAPFRSWLYKIATNACLKELERRPLRLPAQDFGPQADPALPPSAPVVEIVAVDPYPDALLNEIEDRSPGPETQYTLRESIELAFLTLIQILPARQRAVLLLRDVLGWRAAEVATLLEATTASVNSALQRARETLAQGLAQPGRQAASPPASEAAERSLLGRYMTAWERGDMDALTALLREDALLTMPPASTWFEGRDAIAAFFYSLCFSREPKRFRMLATRANGLPAAAAYEWDPGSSGYRFSGLMALRVEGDLVVEITGFGDPRLFALFELPDSIVGDETQ